VLSEVKTIGEPQVVDQNFRGMVVRVEVAVDKKLLNEAINNFKKMRDAARTVRFSDVSINRSANEVVAEIAADTNINIGTIQCVFTYSGMREEQSVNVGDKVRFRIDLTRLSPGKHTCVLELQMKKISPGIENVRRSVTFEITKGQLPFFWFLWNGDASWKHKWFYPGIRGGVSWRDYVLNTTQPGITAEPYLGFEIAALCEIQLFRLLSLQPEIIYSRDEITVNNPIYGVISVSSNTLAIPLLAKLTVRPGIFYLAAFTGPTVILPLGPMEVTQGGATGAYDFSPTLALTGGADAGMKFGPGLLFFDFRYSGDLGFVQSNGDGQYRRNIVSISLGYNYGLVNKTERTVSQ
jgi:hypothetical protein